MPEAETKSRLLRDLNLGDASAIVVGCIIGAGIFRVPSTIAHYLDVPAVILGTWVLGGLLSMTGALCYAELSSLFPKTGGDYVYLREAYGPLVGFLFGWTKLFVERTGTLAIIAFVFAEYLSYLINLPKPFAKYIAIGAILGLTLANILGLKYGKIIQNLFTSLKVLALVSIIGLGLYFFPSAASSGKTFSLAGEIPWSFSLVQSVGMALIFVLWAYGGWTEAAYVAGEVKDPERNVPIAIVGGLTFVMLLYLLVNTVYYLYIPVSEMGNSKLVASVVMEKLLGPWAGKIVALFVACSTFGALNGYVLTGGRILYALAEDHALFHRLSAVHPKFHTPSVALVFNGICATVLVVTKTFDQLMEYTTVVISVFFALTGLAVIVLRRKLPQAERRYKVWAYPWIPLVFMGSTFLFIVNAVWTEPRESLFGFFLVSIGFVLYGISRRMRRASPEKLFQRT